MQHDMDTIYPALQAAAEKEGWENLQRLGHFAVQLLVGNSTTCAGVWVLVVVQNDGITIVDVTEGGTYTVHSLAELMNYLGS